MWQRKFRRLDVPRFGIFWCFTYIGSKVVIPILRPSGVVILSEFDVYAVVGEQVLDRQADQLRSVSQKYENANKLWAAAISNLENKIKVMKQEQTLLSLEAHGHANAVPELSKMVGAVQALVVQCEDLKLKYYEEMPKRKKLHNIVEETKGAGLQGAVVLSNSMNMGCSHGLPVLARASAGTAGLAAARGAGAVGRAQLSLLPRDDHDCCSHSGAHDLQGSECELTTWSATKQTTRVTESATKQHIILAF
ncbi:Os02g0212600 [Oryza sativa Japonica Group]|uniref:Os02g0212600 protein n=1 Tax=Oryza sativa subsp. japonica TaxID=39947 RepID=Q0E2U8_ORYSJ|nr:Os02g0212600 [Oryza sativa Japonica Group]|eukprot:NP_001046276.2 Os02g0212600 [Oryza sativa Japonica Group]